MPDLHIWVPDVSLVEKATRSFVVYFFLVLAFRLAGKRELGPLSPFDYVMLMVLSNSLQNALIGNDNSLSGGLFGAVVLFVINRGMTAMSTRSARFASWFDGEPTVLVRDGVVLQDHLRREMMTIRELHRAIRKHDLDPWSDMHLVKLVLLETDGTVTVLHHTPSEAAEGAPPKLYSSVNRQVEESPASSAAPGWRWR